MTKPKIKIKRGRQVSAQHTPGPWIAHSKGISGAWQITPHGPTSIRVCTVTNAHNDDANAHLIAAAPDLLEALQMALVQIQQDNDERKAEHRMTEIQVRAAIAKAGGAR